MVLLLPTSTSFNEEFAVEEAFAPRRRAANEIKRIENFIVKR
ncbi:MAG: hypothetical protein ACI8RD_005949 [Bacillariaceae sp.]|jgi:hypothetical protein